MIQIFADVTALLCNDNYFDILKKFIAVGGVHSDESKAYFVRVLDAFGILAVVITTPLDTRENFYVAVMLWLVGTVLSCWRLRQFLQYDRWEKLMWNWNSMLWQNKSHRLNAV